MVSLLTAELSSALFAGEGDCLAAACALALWGSSLPASLLRRLIYVTLVEFGSLRYLSRCRRQRCADGDADMLQVCVAVSAELL